MAPNLPPKALIGMVHVAALPGTPGSRLSIDEIATRAVAEARVLQEAGFDAVLVENMHDRPYVNGPHGPETVAAMTRICCDVRAAVRDLIMGVQVLSRGESEAVAIALASGAAFIRCENFVFAHVADEGVMAHAAAGPLLRYRRRIGADHVRVFADIDKKHASHAITSDLSMADWAEAAEFFGADGVIVTGRSTGKAADLSDLAAARKATQRQVLVGSGVTPERAAALLAHADALIVGSWIKAGGAWSNPVDAARCREMAAAVLKARA